MEHIALRGTPVSRLVLGIATAVDHALWDAFVEAGGNAFDTAHWYGEDSERALGTWVASRGLRDEIVLIGKGAHPPDTRPEAVGPQLEQSLERLGTERLDVYLLHRDDPSVPVGEWADALDEQVRAGRARAVGVSNWSARRAEELSAWAAAKGRAAIALLSNHLSLATMLEPVWEGCVTVDDAAEEWLTQTGTPLLAWSALARGFFQGRPDDDEEMHRCWIGADNLERRTRAGQLAARLGVTPAAVALAWVLARPYSSLAVVGPLTVEELAACFRGATLDVTSGDLAELDPHR